MSRSNRLLRGALACFPREVADAASLVTTSQHRAAEWPASSRRYAFWIPYRADGVQQGQTQSLPTSASGGSPIGTSAFTAATAWTPNTAPFSSTSSSSAAAAAAAHTSSPRHPRGSTRAGKGPVRGSSPAAGMEGSTTNTSGSPQRSGTPLLRHPPVQATAPLPSLANCPNLSALDMHIQRHGPHYSLAHVAAGLDVLASLAPAYIRSPEISSSPYPSTVPSAGSEPNPSTSAAGSTLPATATTSLNPSAAAVPAVLTRQCATRLALLGHFQMRREEDLPSLAACIQALAATAVTGVTETADSAGVSSSVSCAEAQRVALALPFVERLRAPGYFYSMNQRPAADLAAMLHSLGKLNPWPHLQAGQRVTFGKVLGRVKASLVMCMGSLEAQDAVLVAQALARLNLPMSGSGPNRPIALALARHITTVLLPRDDLTADQTVRLLWAYGRLLPGACDERQPTAASPSSAAASASASAASPAAAAAAPAGSTMPPGAEVPAPSGGVKPAVASGADAVALSTALWQEQEGEWRPSRPAGWQRQQSEVLALVAGLTRVLRRSLEVQPPLVLVKAMRALSRLHARREAEDLSPQVTPLLLQSLESLDADALVDVAFSYRMLGLSEPGLMQAVADQLVSSGAHLTYRNMHKLLPCYGGGRKHPHAALWDLVCHAVREALPRFERVSAPAKLLLTLDPNDAQEAELVALLKARQEELRQVAPAAEQQ